MFIYPIPEKKAKTKLVSLKKQRKIQRVSIACSNGRCDLSSISINSVKSLYILIIFCTIYEQVHHSVTLIEFQDSVWI